MNVAACDFDGTLFLNGAVSAEDLTAIATWRAAGNVFGIVTGRGRDTLLRDVNRFHVPYDFMICNNGALICDERAQESFRAELSPPLCTAILNHPCMQMCTQCAFFAGESMYVHADKAAYWIVKEHPLPSLSVHEALQLPLHQISLAFADSVESFQWAEELALCCGEGVHFSKICVDITAPDVNKATGMERLLRLRHWDKAETVLVIGDDRNDLPMMQRFSGYAISTAEPEILSMVPRSFPSVGAMLQAGNVENAVR